MAISEHREQVQKFLQECKERDPEKFAEVCDKYAVIGGRQWLRIRDRELPYSSQHFEDLYSSETESASEE